MVWPIRVFLLKATWTSNTPRAAVILWQSLGLAAGIALFGGCIELAARISSNPGPRRSLTDVSRSLPVTTVSRLTPNQEFGLTAGLILGAIVIGTLLTRAVGLRRARAYHRQLLDLVAYERREIPDALIIDDRRATAYSLPGRHGRIVVSSGAVAALASDELAAVLAHERAHVTAHHDLVLFPFETLASRAPRSHALAAVAEDVRTLLEMAADDYALSVSDPCTFARALCKLAGDGDPSLSFGSDSTAVSRRAQRALDHHRRAGLIAVGSGLSSFGVLALPIVAIFVASGGR
jgi:Zn-dependent protease with chaperone function